MADRLRYIASFNEVANTNLELVFELVLDAAVNNHVPQSELPSTLIIISDMEFATVFAMQIRAFLKMPRNALKNMAISFLKLYFGMWQAETVSNPSPKMSEE